MLLKATRNMPDYCSNHDQQALHHSCQRLSDDGIFIDAWILVDVPTNDMYGRLLSGEENETL